MAKSGHRINRKQFLKFSASAVSILAGLGLVSPRKAAAKPNHPGLVLPNILFICSDQERQLAGKERELALPGHARLREQGLEFTNCHVNTSPCGPSRSNIYTGQHTQQTGVYLNPNTPPRPELDPDFKTLGDMLRDQGYYTAYKGKWHLSNINEGKNLKGTAGGIFPNTRDDLEPFGFSDYQFDGEKVGLTWDGFMEDGVVAGDAAAWLYDHPVHASDQPWFLAVNFVNPHDVMFFDATGKQHETRKMKNWIAPLKGAPGDAVYRQDLGLPLPSSFYDEDLTKKPECHRAINHNQRLFYGEIPHDNEAAWYNFQNYYFNCLRDVDQHLLAVLEALEASGQAHNTIIIYTSDHGERAGAHGMRQKGGTIYREDSNVPLIIVAPGLKGGQQTDKLVCAVDLVPTILGLAGLNETQRQQQYPAL